MSEARQNFFFTLIMKNSKILKKTYAKRSKAEKRKEQLNIQLKWPILVDWAREANPEGQKNFMLFLGNIHKF